MRIVLSEMQNVSDEKIVKQAEAVLDESRATVRDSVAYAVGFKLRVLNYSLNANDISEVLVRRCREIIFGN